MERTKGNAEARMLFLALALIALALFLFTPSILAQNATQNTSQSIAQQAQQRAQEQFNQSEQGKSFLDAQERAKKAQEDFAKKLADIQEQQKKQKVGATPVFLGRQGDQFSQDFIVQVVDYYPKILRSDLLEEQDSPIYAQLALVKNNPIINVPKIRSIRVTSIPELEGERFPSKYVNPPSWFSPGGKVPTMEDAGYVRIMLKGKTAEKDMPKVLTIPARATIVYDLEYIPGVKVEDKVLRPLSQPQQDQEFLQELPFHSFWNKAGYVRITRVEGDQVTGQIYDSRIQPISTFTLNRDRKESIFRLPQILSTTYTGEGQGKVVLEGTDAPRVRGEILVNIDGRGTKAKVAEGDILYEGGNWRVKEVTVTDKAQGTGKVILENRATGQEVTLEIAAKDSGEKEEEEKEEKVAEEETERVTGILPPAEFGFASVGTRTITSQYCSPRQNSAPRNYHYGYDFSPRPGSADAGTEVKAVYNGEVMTLTHWGGPANDYAVWVKSKLSDGTEFVTSYGHLSKASITLSSGQSVKKGDFVGKIYDDHLDVKMFWLPLKEEDYWRTAFNFDKGQKGRWDKCPGPTQISLSTSSGESASSLLFSAEKSAARARELLPLVMAQEVDVTETYLKNVIAASGHDKSFARESGESKLLTLYKDEKIVARFEKRSGLWYSSSTPADGGNFASLPSFGIKDASYDAIAKQLDILYTSTMKSQGQSSTTQEQPPAQTGGFVQDIVTNYNTAIDSYWKVVFEYSGLEINQDQAGLPEDYRKFKTWDLLALGRIITFSSTFARVENGKGFKSEYVEFGRKINSDLLRAYEYIEVNYPDVYGAEYKDQRDVFTNYSMSKASGFLQDVNYIEGIRVEETAVATLTGISIPDANEKSAEVIWKDGEADIELHEGDIFFDVGGSRIIVNSVTEKDIVIGGKLAEEKKEGEDVKKIDVPGLKGLSFSYGGNFQDRDEAKGERNKARIKLYAENFQQKFMDADWFLGRQVEIKAESVVLNSPPSAENQKAGLTITKQGLSGIKGSLNINFKRSAHIKIIPASQGKVAQADFLLHISVEKRLIQLSPKQMLQQANASRATAEKIKSITNSLGKVIETWKGACFATSGALFAKNFVENLHGKSAARAEVMAAYKVACAKETGYNKKYKQPSDCFREKAKEIEAATSIIKDAKEKSSALFDAKNKEGIILKETKDGEEIERVNISMLVKVLKRDYDIDADESLNSIGKYQDNSKYDILTTSQVQDLLFKLEVKEKAGKSGGDTILNQEYGEFADKDLKELQDSGKALGAKITRFNNAMEGQEGRMKKLGSNGLLEPVNIKEDGEFFIKAVDAIDGKRDFGPYYIGEKDKEKKMALIYDPTTNNHLWKEVVNQGGGKGNQVEIGGKDEKRYRDLYFRETCTFEGAREEIKFYGSGPYRGKPFITPFPLGNGDGTIQIEKYDTSGKPTRVVVTAPTKEGSCDGPWLYVAGQDIAPSRSQALMNAFRMIEHLSSLSEAEKKGGLVKGFNIGGEGRRYKISAQKLASTGAQCEDFMSPQDCEILFQVCDPVMCPASRFNMGGRWEVADVVQTGLFGSIILGLPNYPHPAVPICLPGVRAGLQNYASILDAYAACMEDSAKTGKTSGICDRIRSIYVCEMLWKEGLAIANSHGGLVDLLGKATSKAVGGGVEYLDFKQSLDKVGESARWFTTTYAAPVFSAFKARTGQEIGTYVCQAAFFGRLPGVGSVLSELSKPESPPQFMAFIEEIPYSDVGQGQFGTLAQSQYKVFFHILSGDDKGIFYRIYLKDRASLPGEPVLQQYEISGQRTQGRGFIPAGQFVSETVDFLAPSGFKQVCIEIDGLQHCGFGKVTTDFIFNYASDLYLKRQLEKPVKNADECISGTASNVPLQNIPFQGTSAVSDALRGGIQRGGIARVCDAQDPGKGVSPGRWKVVGTCGTIGGQEMSCWMDTSSVKSALTDLKFKDETLQRAEVSTKKFLEEKGFFTPGQSNESILEAERLRDEKKYAEAVKAATNVYEKTLEPVIKARALLVIADSNARISEPKRPILYEDVPVAERTVAAGSSFDINVKITNLRGEEITSILPRGTFNIEVEFSSEDKPYKIVLLKDGVEFGKTDERTFQDWTYEYSIAEQGEHTIEARVTDAEGRVGKASAKITVGDSASSSGGGSTGTAGGATAGVVVGTAKLIGTHKYRFSIGDTLTLGDYTLTLDRVDQRAILFFINKKKVANFHLDYSGSLANCNPLNSPLFVDVDENGNAGWTVASNEEKCKALLFSDISIQLEPGEFQGTITIDPLVVPPAPTAASPSQPAERLASGGYRFRKGNYLKLGDYRIKLDSVGQGEYGLAGRALGYNRKFAKFEVLYKGRELNCKPSPLVVYELTGEKRIGGYGTFGAWDKECENLEFEDVYITFDPDQFKGEVSIKGASAGTSPV